MTSAAVAAALDDLVTRDPVIADLAARHGPPRLGRPVPVGDRFAVLVRSVLSQQLAGPAARAIHGRLVDRVTGDITPGRLLDLGPGDLGACGISRAKAAAVTDLATRVDDGRIPLDRMGRLGDDEIVACLTETRGVGVWTAEMFLLNALGRLDVWPVGDLGVRVGFAHAWQLDAVPAPRALSEAGEPFRPHRSIVAWYCWRAADDRAAARPGPRDDPRPGPRHDTVATAPVPALRRAGR
jgi:3-methyladenine DNA glycosylase/8-oxoguanine DNA glycosylase